MRVRQADGATVDARIKGKKLRPVCGDRVIVEPIAGEIDWLITAILPRSNELKRPNMRGDVEVLAANIDLVIVVAAASPPADWYVVDRYLCAAESMDAAALLVFNKTDIASGDEHFADYARIGYETLSCSATSKENIEEFDHQIGDRTAIMVGQSGVGKSSIINALLGDEAQRTATISGKTKEGRHTTVNSAMLETPGGGRVIDSPGVRDYAPALHDPSQVKSGYREISAASGDCRFADCRHLREPHCAVKSGVESGSISARRYESYRRLLALTERLDRMK